MVFAGVIVDELAALLTSFIQKGFPFTATEIREIVYEFAWSNEIEGFSEEKGKAGWCWWSKFLERYPQFSMKKATNLSVARAMGANPTSIKTWFVIYKEVLEKLDLKESPKHIWNLDEKGLKDVPRADRFVGLAKFELVQMVCGEKGELSTLLQCISASGVAMEPMIIHKGKKIGKNWKDNAFPGTIVECSDRGYVNKEIFLRFGARFINKLEKLGLLEDQKNLLLMDSHLSHMLNYPFMSLMKEYNVTVLAFPPHTTHLLQPLDKVPFKEMEQHWNRALRKHNRETGGKKLTKGEFFSTFNMPYLKAFTPRNIIAGFKATGIYPVEEGKVKEEKLIPSTVTDCCKFDSFDSFGYVNDSFD